MYHSQGKEKKLFSGLTREEMKNLCIIHRGGDKGPCFLDSLARGRRACTSFIGGGGGRGCFVGSLGREESLFIIHRGGERGCFLDSLARERRACASFIGEGKEIVLWAHLGGKTSLFRSYLPK